MRCLSVILPAAGLLFGAGQAAHSPPGGRVPEAASSAVLRAPADRSGAPTGSPPGGLQPGASSAPRSPIDRFSAAADYSEANGGLSMLVMVDGAVVFERYGPGNLAQDAHPLASGTKSFCGVLLAAAVADGLVSSLDEPVCETIHEWRADPRKSRITLRQLLSLTGGVEPGGSGPGGIGRPPSYADAIEVETFAEPGTAFRYGPAPFQVFGEVLRRKLAGAPSGESVRGYLDRRILRPLGIEAGRWTTDVDGNINLPSGASLSAREWATFGEMLRNEGRVRSDDGWTQVVPSELLAELRRGSAVNPGYGVTFWLLSGIGGMDPEDGLRGRLPSSGQGAGGGTLRDRLRERLGAKRAGERAKPEAADAQNGSRGSGRKTVEEPRSGETAADAGTAATSGRAGPAPSWSTDASMAAGLGKQRLYVLPHARMVVVRQGRLERGSDFKDAEFLKRLMEDAGRPDGR